ncbi:hypothetical protein ACIREO_22475 [Streptomyces sp. NPDC102441]|uniref:hypothetical protein n=1 Tax=Streptomyces sp. NPDC102441 TaxID=3366176 RepID=UPI003813BE5D
MNRTRQTVVATLIAGSALLGVAACSGSDSNNATAAAKDSPASASPNSPEVPVTPAAEGSQQADGPAVAQLKGGNGIEGKVHSVQRKDGMVMVKFDVTNRSDKDYLTVDWRDGTEVYTLAGSSIVDRTHKKRYMALVDTNGRCLCSEHTASIDKGQTRQLYAQFEAPSTDVKQVDLALGTLSVVTVPIQEG